MSSLEADSPLFFLDADLQDVRRQHATMSTDIEAAGKDMGEANRQSSETWHDNAPLDVAQRKFERLSEQHRQLGDILRRAVVVPDYLAPGSVGPASSVVLETAFRERFHTRQSKSKTMARVKRRTLHFVDSLLADTQDEANVTQHLLGRCVGDVVSAKVSADTAKTVLGVDIQTRDEAKPETLTHGEFELTIGTVSTGGRVMVGSVVEYTVTYERTHRVGFQEKHETLRKPHRVTVDQVPAASSTTDEPKVEIARVLLNREANDRFKATLSARAAMANYRINIQPTYKPPPKRQNDQLELKIVDIIPSPCATIGSRVTYEVDGRGESTVQIGSYVVNPGGRRVSYTTPIARLLLGLEEGDVQAGSVGGQQVEIEVLSIEPT